MSRLNAVIRCALLMGATSATFGCTSDDAKLVEAPAADPIFQSYVALGNSITAGFQSAGINDSTQKQSYAVLLAAAMQTRFAYPALTMPGCPPPLNNLLTQSRVTLKGDSASTGTTCRFRVPGSVTSVLNNVAVPGVTSFDPTAPVGPAASALTQLFLGGKTMVMKALDAQPTFATVWIGNNDVLGPGTSGLIGTATPLDVFRRNYDIIVRDLVAGAPGLKGVLIAVAQVPNVPLMIPAAAFTNPAVLGAASQVAGRAVSLDPVTCAGTGLGSLIDFQYLAAIRARPAGFPGTIFCSPISGGGQTDLGDFLVLDPTETASLTTLISGYNSYIKAKADSVGFAFFDPNPLLAGLKASGAVPVFPNLTSVTQPFGQFFSLDGVHPSAAAHILIADSLVAVINAKYGTTLVKP